MVALRMFSYLPNPRLMKATIAARLCEIEVDIRGDKADNLSDWLWDFDARPLVNSDYERTDVVAKSAHTGFGKKLYKTEQFLICLLYTSPSPRDATLSRMPSSA